MLNTTCQCCGHTYVEIHTDPFRAVLCKDCAKLDKQAEREDLYRAIGRLTAAGWIALSAL